MIVKEEFLKKLRSMFDLNIYEVKIWTALLSKGVATAGELSDISNVPRSRSYDVLETLEKKGFVIMKIGKPIKYIAVKPEEVLTRVKKGLKKKADEHIKMLDNIRDTGAYKELEILHRNGIENIDPSSLSGALRGRGNLYDHLESMIRDAKKSVMLVTTSDGLVRKADLLSSVFRRLKNVNIRIAAPINKEAKDVAKELSKYATIRNISKVNARFCIVDGKELLFMVSDDSNVHESYDSGVWVNTPYFAKALESMFNSNWVKLESYDKVK